MVLLITFASTTQAMAFERAAKAWGIKGRLIPVPGEIHAGCGLAWRGELDTAETIKEMIQEKSLNLENIFQLIL